MIPRKLERELKILAKEFPVVALLGPRQSGKTTLSKAIFNKYKYVSLEDPDIRSIAIEDPRGFLRQYDKYVIIDEIQRAPELLSYLQSHVDNLNKEGLYIITGSQNYLLMEKVSQSLAGRIGISVLLPFSIEELSNYNIDLQLEKLVFTGGYPRIYDKKIRPSAFYKSYLNTYIERDVRLLKNIVDYDLFIKFLKVLSGRTGQVLNTLAISEDCGISHNTVKEWISILVTSYIIYKLQPYYKNYKKRLIKNPKIYFYDTGLVCYLLGLKNIDNLNTHYLKGNIFETFIISELVKYNYNRGESYNFYYWRDNHRKEIDLLLEEGLTLKSIEIKSGDTIQDSFFKGLKYWNKLSCNDPENSYLIYSGDNNLVRDSINILGWKDLIKVFK